jgi:hypothetical protein
MLMNSVIYKALIKSPEGYYCVRTLLEDGTPITLDIFKTYEKARQTLTKLPYRVAPTATVEAFAEITQMAS